MESRRRVVTEGLQEKAGRLTQLASTIKKGDIVALGAAESERRAQNIKFYLGKVVVPPALADKRMRVGGSGRGGWNIKKDEWFLKLRWLKEIDEGVFVDEGYEENQLLEMVVQHSDGATLELQTLSTGDHGRPRRHQGPPKFELAAGSKAALDDANLTKYVDRAAPGSSA